jgi:surface antigen
METEISTALISTLGGGILSGVLVLLLSHRLTRHKTDAEIRALEANTQKTMLEMSQMRNQAVDERQTRVIGRMRLDNNHTLLFKEEKRTIRG